MKEVSCFVRNLKTLRCHRRFISRVREQGKIWLLIRNKGNRLVDSRTYRLIDKCIVWGRTKENSDFWAYVYWDMEKMHK